MPTVEQVRIILERTLGFPVAERDAQIVFDRLVDLARKEAAEQKRVPDLAVCTCSSTTRHKLITACSECGLPLSPIGERNPFGGKPITKGIAKMDLCKTCPSCTWRMEIELTNGTCPQCGVNWHELQAAEQRVQRTACPVCQDNRLDGEPCPVCERVG